MDNKLIVCAGLAVAGMASATIIYEGSAVHAQDLESATRSGLATSGIPYSNMELASNFVLSSTAADGVVSLDDYDSVADDDISLGEFRFVGGVDVASGVLFFEFYDAAGTFIDEFGVRLTNPGNFIYTITLTTGNLTIADAGFVQMVADNDGTFGVATIGTWFLNSVAPTVGTTDAFTPASNLGQPLDHKFELIATPAPGAAALVGFGGMVAARRRR